MRITPKQKRVTTQQSAQHLEFNSTVHRLDRNAADRLRTSISIPAPEVMYARKEIVFARQLATQGVFDSGEWATKKGDEFSDYLMQQAKSRSWYRDKNGKKRQSKGAILDSYASLPPWWSKTICDQVRAGKLTIEQAKKIVVEIGMVAIQELAKRTGYEAVYFSMHPESENNLHFHFGLATISSENKLIGRSASGTVGKKGLKTAGDSTLALARFAKNLPDNPPKLSHEVLKKAVGYATKEPFDDIAIAKLIDKTLEEKFPLLVPRVRISAQAHVREWMGNVEDGAKNSPVALAAENATLKEENAELKPQVETLKTENKSLKEENAELKTRVEILEATNGNFEEMEEGVAENNMVDEVPRPTPDQISKSERDAILEKIANFNPVARGRDLEDELEQDL